MACMLSAMVLFPASKDYKLGLLSGVFCFYVIYLQEQLQHVTRNKEILVNIIFSLIAVCYCIVLFSEAYRPVILKNSFPVLYLLMIGVTGIEFVLFQKQEKGVEPTVF